MSLQFIERGSTCLFFITSTLSLGPSGISYVYLPIPYQTRVEVLSNKIYKYRDEKRSQLYILRSVKNIGNDFDAT